MGRNPAHLASLCDVDQIRPLVKFPELFCESDLLGRTALHYAAASGQVDLVKQVFNLLEPPIDIDKPDKDNWTPLMWAARFYSEWEDSIDEQGEIIEFLLSQGASLWSRGLGSDREWSPLKIARYCSAPRRITQLLIPDSKKRTNPSGETESWDDDFHMSNVGQGNGKIYCDACLLVGSSLYLDLKPS